MRQAFECTNPAWGQSYVIGVAPHGRDVCATPAHLILGRHWPGCYMGGARLDRLPEIGDWYMERKIERDSLITHRLALDQVNEGLQPMRRGEPVRTVIAL